MAASAVVFLLLWPVVPGAAVEAPVRPAEREFELAHLRTATSETFGKANGEMRTVVHAQPVHYRDRETREWRKIKRSFVESARAGFRWRNEEAAFAAELRQEASEGLLRFEAGSAGFELTLEGGARAAGARPRGDAVVYRNVFGEVDLEYELLGSGVKETLVLHDRSAPASYRFVLTPLEGKQFELQERGDGALEVRDGVSADPAAVIAAPIVSDSRVIEQTDAGGTRSVVVDDAPAVGKARMRASKREGGGYTITVEIDEEWLRAPERRFPVKLDPTVTTAVDLQDGYYPMYAGSLPDMSEDVLRLGRNGESGDFYSVPIVFALADIPPAATISSARLDLHLGGCMASIGCGWHTGNGQEAVVRVRRLSGPWSAITPWSSVSIDSTILAERNFSMAWNADQPGWKSWENSSLLSHVQSVVTQAQTNYGLILQKEGGNPNWGLVFGSSRGSDPNYSPKLEVQWVAEGVQLNQVTNVHSDGPELTWTRFASGYGPYAASVLADSPRAYWRMNDASGSPFGIADWSGNSLHASPASTTHGQPGATLDGDTSLYFSGSASRMDVPESQVTDTFTIEAWVKRGASGSRETIFSRGESNGGGFRLQFNPNNRLELGFGDCNGCANGNFYAFAEATVTTSDTAWHHVVATKSGGTVKLYIDGIDRTNIVNSVPTLTNGLGMIVVGANIATDYECLCGARYYYDYFNGYIDEAAVYPTALSASRVAAHFAAGSATGSGFLRFEIHRSQSAGFTPSAASLIATIRDPVLQHYRDTTAKASTTFHYKVVTFNTAGSAASNELTVATPAAGTSTLTIQPGVSLHSVETTTLSSTSTCANNGGAGGITASATQRALLRFDLRQIPTESTITAASLSLFTFQNGGGRTLDLHRITGDWTEGDSSSGSCNASGASWADRQPNVPWSSAGADFQGSAVGSFTSSGTVPHWETLASPAFVTLVDEWTSAGKPNLGLLLKHATETGAPAITWTSDDYRNAVTLRPKLTVTYTDESQPKPPSVSMGAPGAGAALTGNVTVTASAGDDSKVTQVEFLRGTTVFATDTAAPWEATLATGSLASGQYELFARATDDVGHTTTSAPIAVTVANSAPPSTSITSATGTASITIDASAADDVAVNRLEFYVDGDRFATDSTAPYQATLETLTLPVYDGSHTLTTRAYDGDGNVTVSADYPLTVANTAGSKYRATIAATTAVPSEVRYEAGAPSQEQNRATISITNTSSTSWPASTTYLRYRWISPGGQVTDSANISLGSDLLASQTRAINVDFEPPALATGLLRSLHTLRFDLVDTSSGADYFAAKGNKPLERQVLVTRVSALELGLERYQQYEPLDLGGGTTAAANLASGNLVLDRALVDNPGRGLATVIELTHNAQEVGSFSPVGAGFSLGTGLSRLGQPLDIHPNASDTALGRTEKWIGFADTDGSYHRFLGRPISGGTYYDEPAGVHLYLRATGSSDPDKYWSLTRPDRIRFYYDQAGWPTRVEDANGNALTYTLASVPAGEDAYGLAKRVTKITDAGGRDVTLSYFSKAETPTPALRGRLKSITDHAGLVTRFGYYDDGNLMKVTQAGGVGDDGSHVPARSLIFTYTNQAGTGPAIATLAGRQNPAAGTVQGKLLYSLIDYRGNESSFAYHTSGANQNRLSGWTDRAGKTTSFTYPSVTTTTVARPLNRNSSYLFDTSGRVAEITNPLGLATAVEWTSDNNVKKVTNNTTGRYLEYAYNQNGYLTDSWDEERNHTLLTYENLAADGADTSANWPAGRTIPHLSQLATQTQPVGVATTGNPSDYRWSFGYSATGNLLTITDPLNKTTTHSYNADGTLQKTTLPSNGDGLVRETVYDAYDANGLATQVTDAAGGIARTSYGADGRPLWVQDPLHAGESGSDSRRYRTVYDYDGYGRLIRESSPKSTLHAPGLLIWEETRYDANDNAVAEIAGYYAREGGGHGSTTTSSYDPMDRPLDVVGPDTSSGGTEITKTVYDDAGRTTKVVEPKGVRSAAADDFTTITSYDLLDRPATITEYELDTNGAIVPAKTRTSVYCYDAAGDLRSVTGPKGASGFSCPSATAWPYTPTSQAFTTKYSYDQAHRQLSVTDPLGRTSSSSYDANGAPLTETDPLGKTTEHYYTDRGELEKTITPFDGTRKITEKTEYDALGNVARKISPRAWDASPDKVNFSAFVERYRYDKLNRLTRTDLPEVTVANNYAATVLADTPGGYWRLGENSGTTLANQISGGNAATLSGSATLDTAGATADGDGAISFTGGNASVSSYSGINPAARATIEWWYKGAVPSSANWLIAKSSSNNSEPYLQYGVGANSSNQVKVALYTYCCLANNTWNTGVAWPPSDGQWHHFAVTYDATAATIKLYVDGDLKATNSSATGGGMGSFATPLRLMSADWLGGTQQGQLDEVAIYTTALGADRIQAHYAARQTAAGQSYIHQTYDANGNLTAVTLPTPHQDAAVVPATDLTQNQYWDTGALYATTVGGAPKTRFDYTAEGWQTWRLPETAEGTGVAAYDQMMFWEHYRDGLLRAERDLAGRRSFYSYDANGNQTGASEAQSITGDILTIASTFDGFDQLAQVKTPKPGTSNFWVSSLNYDTHGNVTSLLENQEQNASGGQVNPARGFTYTYYNDDQPETQADDFGTTAGTDDERFSFSFDNAGRLESRTVAKANGGSWTTEQVSTRTYYENDALKTLVTKDGTTPTPATVASHSLSYVSNSIYLNGNIAADTFRLLNPDSNAPCRTSDCTASWIYDGRDRLISENTGTGSTSSFTLDEKGNIIQEQRDGTAHRTATYTGNRLTTDTIGATSSRYLYDGLGNVDCIVAASWVSNTCPTAATGQTIATELRSDNVYDYRSRLVAVRNYTNGTPGDRSEYSYDPLGRPTKKVSTFGAESSTTEMVYLGVDDEVVRETETGSTTKTRSYAFDALGDRATLTENGSRYSYVIDHRTSVEALLNQANEVKAAYGYRAYGEANPTLTKPGSGFSPSTNLYRYTGKRFDPAAKAYDMGARHYFPDQARWFQQDTYTDALDNLGLATDPLNSNRYLFTGANPINFIELDGHKIATVRGFRVERGSSSPWKFIKKVAPYTPYVGTAISLVKAGGAVARGDFKAAAGHAFDAAGGRYLKAGRAAVKGGVAVVGTTLRRNTRGQTDLVDAADKIRRGAKHPAAANQRTIAVGQGKDGKLYAGSSNGFDSGQRAVAKKLGVQCVRSRAGCHAEENLLREVPDLRRVGTSIRSPCGPGEHNCRAQLKKRGVKIQNGQR